MDYFQQKTVYITGAASGLGLESAIQLAKRGANLVLFDVSSFDEVLPSINAAKKDDKQVVVTQQADITDAQQLVTSVDALAKEHTPDVCLHFAGVAGPWTFDNMTQEQFERVVNINLFGTRNWLAAVRPHLKRGAQVMVAASMASFVGSYGYTSYAASKFAVWGMMQSIRCEWKPLGIDVTLFFPPHIVTPLTDFEVEVMDKTGLFMKKTAGKVDKSFAIECLLKGISKREFMVVPGKMANLLWLQLRFLPQPLINTVADVQVKISKRLAS